ncbi:hypothetical protein ScPMuIL_001845 [Solemya velum]
MYESAESISYIEDDYLDPNCVLASAPASTQPDDVSPSMHKYCDNNKNNEYLQVLPASFEDQRQLENHEELHRSIDALIGVEASADNYQCDQCSACFDDRRNRKAHAEAHSYVDTTCYDVNSPPPKRKKIRESPTSEITYHVSPQPSTSRGTVGENIIHHHADSIYSSEKILQPGSADIKKTDPLAYEIEKVGHRTFKHLAEDHHFKVEFDTNHIAQDTPLSDMYGALEQMFDDVLAEIAPRFKETDLVRVIIHHDTLTNSIYVQLTPLGEMTADKTLSYLTNVLNSNQSLTMNTSFRTDVGVIRLSAEGIGLQINNISREDSSLIYKKSIIQILSDDNTCLPRAVTVCNSCIDEDITPESKCSNCGSSRIIWKFLPRLSCQLSWKIGLRLAAFLTESKYSMLWQKNVDAPLLKFLSVECTQPNIFKTFMSPWLPRTMDQQIQVTFTNKEQPDSGDTVIVCDQLHMLNVDEYLETTMEIQQLNCALKEDSVTGHTTVTRKRRNDFTKEEAFYCRSDKIHGNLKNDEIPKKHSKKSNKGKVGFEPDSNMLKEVPKKTVLPKKLLQHVTDKIRKEHITPKCPSPKVMPSITEAVGSGTDFNVVFETELHWISYKPESFIAGLGVDTIMQSTNSERNSLTQDCAIHATDYSDCLDVDVDIKSSLFRDKMLNVSAISRETLKTIAPNDTKNKHNTMHISNRLISDEEGTTLIDDVIEEDPCRSRCSHMEETYSDECDVSVLFSEKFVKEYKEIKESRTAAKEHLRSEKASSEDQDVSKAKKKGKPKRPTPNYFVAVQISNPEIHNKLKAVQDSILKSDPQLKPAMNPIATLHVTMFVMYLDTEDEMERAEQALEKCVGDLRSVYSEIPLQLEIASIGNFKDEVVFAQIKPGGELDQLHAIADKVQQCFKEHQIPSADKRGFKPHITFMKLSRAGGRRRKRGVKKIDSALYKDYKDTCFGIQRVTGLQVCAMLKPKATDGYYQLLHQVRFASTSTSDSQEESSAQSVCHWVIDSCIDKVIIEDQQEAYICDRLQPKPSETISTGDESDSVCILEKDNIEVTSETCHQTAETCIDTALK